MGKARQNKVQRIHGNKATKKNAKHAVNRLDAKTPNAKTKPLPSKKVPHVQSSQVPEVPFQSTHCTLLIGEGDFSFALSLQNAHACTILTCTTFESREVLLTKYPQAEAHITALEAAEQKVLYSIDATKLGRLGGGGVALRKLRWDRIVFNFPHVGGLTKDVNRQVRANQELLVKFFEAAKPLLAPGGLIVVTIFDGEPYELWGIRNLVRHAGMVVERSMRFQAKQYPGYRHARTLGNLRGETGWKGEARPARMFLFGLPDEGGRRGEPNTGKRRKNVDSDSEEEGEDAA